MPFNPAPKNLSLAEAIKEIEKQLTLIENDTFSNPNWITGAKHGLEIALRILKQVEHKP